jgi:hypothetical protein
VIIKMVKETQSVEFCQIKGDACIEAAPADLSENSIFAAYPFDPKTKDHMEYLQKQLHDLLYSRRYCTN